MSGVKIKSAISNVLAIFDGHISSNDFIMVITFNGKVVVNIPLSKKEGNETAIRESISKLILPSGSTGMHDSDAILDSFKYNFGIIIIYHHKK